MNVDQRELQTFTVKASGRDVVSTNMAEWLTENANGAMGALPAVTKAVQQLRDAAEQVRATAASYGIADDGGADAITGAGSA